MSYRNVTPVLLLTLLLETTAVSVASACARTEWVYDATAFPSCVTLTRSGVHGFEVRNDCADELTLTTSSECSICALPAPIPAGEVDLLDLGGQPAVDDDTVEIDWQSGATSGTASFSFPINRCPGQEGCSATPGTSTSLAWSLPALLGAAALCRRRVRRRVS